MDEVIIPEVSDKSRVTLLHKWYKRDDNAVPAQYVLQVNNNNIIIIIILIIITTTKHI